jgi:regulatory protein
VPRRIARPAEPDSAEAAYARGLRLLTARARGRVELLRDLTRRGFGAAAARTAAAKLEAEGWLRDADAARGVVRVRGARHGRRRLARELAARGFDPETARAALDELPPTREDEALARAAERLWKASAKSPLPDRRRRVRRALLARGFAPGKISEIMRGFHEVDRGPGKVP